MQAQISELKKQLAAALHVVAQSSSQRVRASRELEGKFNEALTRQRQKLLSIRQLQDEGAKLLLELESAQSVYKRALDGYDQIMFASAGKHANVSLIARAVPPSKPSKPSKVKLLLAAIAVGLFSGLAGPLAYELLINRRIRCRDDLERELGIPVLVELGPLSSAQAAA